MGKKIITATHPDPSKFFYFSLGGFTLMQKRRLGKVSIRSLSHSSLALNIFPLSPSLLQTGWFEKVSTVCRLYLRVSEDPFRNDFNFKYADLDASGLLETWVASCDSPCSLRPSLCIRLSLCLIHLDHFHREL